ncbi:hypothetical protein BD779DRAFT_1676542 [Infundibulicybe gibba]|nr:hypothetical protein BD779DRAFT_1676542 [Infundibulicybe gibba]
MANRNQTDLKKNLTRRDLEHLSYILSTLDIAEPECDTNEANPPRGFICIHCHKYNPPAAEDTDTEYPYTRPPSPSKPPLVLRQAHATPRATKSYALRPAKSAVLANPMVSSPVHPIPHATPESCTPQNYAPTSGFSAMGVPFTPVTPAPGFNLEGGWYTVTVGRDVGIFTDWNYTSTLVNKVPGAVHKKYSTYAIACTVWLRAEARGSISVVPM